MEEGSGGRKGITLLLGCSCRSVCWFICVFLACLFVWAVCLLGCGLARCWKKRGERRRENRRQKSKDIGDGKGK